MTDKTAARVVPEAKILAWLDAFQTDAPLYTQFPVTLKNGKTIPGVHIKCQCCDSTISGNMVRGRVVQSLPHVVTVEANGLCQPCDRLTHIDCRFRANGAETLVEWLGTNGLWNARECRQPTLGEKVSRGLRRLVAKWAPAH